MTIDRDMLTRAALAARRGFGHVEPNPMVGCVIGRDDGTVLGIGHHRRFGGLHAEVEALRNCELNGHDPRGGTAWVTLEPCSHFGKQPPCAEALIRAGIARVVAARLDPNPVSAGGGERLAAAGIRFEISTASPLAHSLADPFVKRLSTGMPWVIAKWAQTIDGKVAATNGESKWISGPASRRRVHILRGRVDIILTAIGTVLADDPLLTARGVPARRIARRIVIDPDLRIPESSALIRSADVAPLSIVVAATAPTEKRQRLASAGIEMLDHTRGASGIAIAPLLEDLARRYQASTVMIEAGPGLLGRAFAQDCVDEAHVFIAPRLLGDPSAPSAAHIAQGIPLDAGRTLRLVRASRSGDDLFVCWRR